MLTTICRLGPRTTAIKQFSGAYPNLLTKLTKMSLNRIFVLGKRDFPCLLDQLCPWKSPFILYFPTCILSILKIIIVLRRTSATNHLMDYNVAKIVSSSEILVIGSFTKGIGVFPFKILAEYHEKPTISLFSLG